MIPICLVFNKFNLKTLGTMEYEGDTLLPTHIDLFIDNLWMTYGDSFEEFVEGFTETISHETLHYLIMSEGIFVNHHSIIDKLHKDLFGLEISKDMLKNYYKKKKRAEENINLSYV